MNSKLLVHLRTNVIAYLALFVALSGTAIAATKLPRNSVGTDQIKKKSITGAKIKANTITGRHIKESTLSNVRSATNATNATSAQNAFIASTAGSANFWDGIDSAVLGSTETLAGMNFVPRDSNAVEKTYETTGAISCTGTPGDFTQRVQLPQGARIARLDYRFVDNDGGVNSGLEIRAFNTFDTGGGASTVVVANAASTGSAAGRRTVTADPTGNATVNNNRFSYQLNWSPFACASNMQLVGAAVRYTLPKG